MRDLDVRLFGALRPHGPRPTITLSVDAGATVATVRAALAERLGSESARALLAASAFATDERVLDDGEAVPEVRELAALPPVCGG
jgi:molybdopterin converting factor small subunit